MKVLGCRALRVTLWGSSSWGEPLKVPSKGFRGVWHVGRKVQDLGFGSFLELLTV